MLMLAQTANIEMSLVKLNRTKLPTAEQETSAFSLNWHFKDRW